MLRWRRLLNRWPLWARPRSPPMSAQVRVVLFRIWLLWQWHRFLQRQLPKRSLPEQQYLDVLGTDTDAYTGTRLH